MKITITEQDILKNREAVSDTGRLIDELAYSAGESTSADLWESESGHYARDYVVKDYDYERALLEQTRTVKSYSAVTGELHVAEAPRITPSKHVGATVALEYPEHWRELLAEYTHKLKDEAYSYFDSDFLSKYAEGFAKELQNTTDEAEMQDYQEWLHGDYHGWDGVLRLIAAYYGASEALDYDDKTGEQAVFTFEEDTMRENVCGYDDEEILTNEKAKAWLVDSIIAAINNRSAKDQAEAAKRKAERERVAAYQAARKAQAEAERVSKLEALTK